MPVKGVSKVKSNMKRVFKDIDEKKAKQFVTSVITFAANESKKYAPVEYSNLVNSMMMEVNQTSDMTVGTVSYNVNYAAALEFGSWKPVPASMKKGPSDNMQATPHYLRKGFESPESKRAIDKFIDIFRI